MTRRYREAFGRLWGRFANDFLNDMARREYNSLKHGFRIDPGGFSVSVGWERSPGLPCPPEAMHSIGGSQFGSSFFVKEKFHKHNFTIQRCLRNWMPANFVRALKLVSISLYNIVSWLRLCNGVAAEELLIRCPETLGEFDGPWKDVPGVESSLDVSVPVDRIKPLSKEAILSVYEPADKVKLE